MESHGIRIDYQVHFIFTIPNNLVQEEHIYGININTNGKKYTNTVMEEKGCKDCCITKIILIS